WNNIGNALNKMGRHAESLKYHDKSLEIKPDFDYALYAKGHALDNLGRHEEGLELIGQSLELNPNYDHAWMAKAEALHRLGRPADALVPADEARSRHPTDPRGWLSAGRAFAAMGRGAEAIESFEKAKASGAGEASLELARWHHSIGGDAEALDALKGEAQLSSEALLLRADIHAALGHTDEALADHDAAIRSPSEGRDLAYRRKGQRLLDLGRPK